MALPTSRVRSASALRQPCGASYCGNRPRDRISLFSSSESDSYRYCFLRICPRYASCPIIRVRRAPHSPPTLGAIVHPIMLNKLFHSAIGFHNGVRMSACINVALLVAACLMMRTRLPPKAVQQFPVVQWLKEPPYLLLLIA